MAFVNAWSTPTGINTASINVCCDANDVVLITMSGGSVAGQYQPTVGDGHGVTGGFSLWKVTGMTPNVKRSATVRVNGSIVATIVVRPLYSGKPKRYYTALTMGCDRNNYDSSLLVDVLNRLEAGELYRGVTEADLIINLGDLCYKGWGGGTPDVLWGQTVIGTDSGAPYAAALNTNDTHLWAWARLSVARQGSREAYSRVPVFIQRDDHETANNWPDLNGMNFSDYTSYDEFGSGVAPVMNQAQVDAIIDNKKVANRYLMAGNPGTVGPATSGDEEDFYVTEMGVKWLVSDTAGKFKRQTGIGNPIVSSAQQARLLDALDDAAPEVIIHASPKTYWPTNGDGWADYSAAIGTAYSGSNGQLLQFLEAIPDGTVQRFASVCCDRHWGFAGVGVQAGKSFLQMNQGSSSQELSGTDPTDTENGRPVAEARTNGDWRAFGIGVIVYDTVTQKLNMMTVGYDGEILYSEALNAGSNIPVEDYPMPVIEAGYKYEGQPIKPDGAQAVASGEMKTSKISPNDGSPDIDPTYFTVPAEGAVLGNWFACVFRDLAGTRSSRAAIYPWNGANITGENPVAISALVEIPQALIGASPPPIVEFPFAGEILPAGTYVALLSASQSNVMLSQQDASVLSFETDSVQRYIAADGVFPSPAGAINSLAGWPYYLWGTLTTIDSSPTTSKAPMPANSSFKIDIAGTKKSVVQGIGNPTVGATEMGIWLGSAVSLYARQSIVGTLKVLHRYLINNLRSLSGEVSTLTLSCGVGGTLPNVAKGGIPGTSDIQLIVGLNFLTQARSGFITESFAQLLASVIEASTGN